jgi:hypothetical protein
MQGRTSICKLFINLSILTLITAFNFMMIVFVTHLLQYFMFYTAI